MAQLRRKLQQLGHECLGMSCLIPRREIERARVQAARASQIVENRGAAAATRDFERGGGARDARADDRDLHRCPLPEPISACSALSDSASWRAWAAPTAALRRRAAWVKNSSASC